MIRWELVGGLVEWTSQINASEKRKSRRVFSTWSPAPTSSSARLRWTPFAMSGDCCSIATSRFKVRQSNPTPFRYYLVSLWMGFEFWGNFHLGVNFIFFVQVNSIKQILDTSRLVVVLSASSRTESLLTLWRIIVANVLYGVAHDLLIIYVGLWRDLSAKQNHSGLADGF